MAARGGVRSAGRERWCERVARGGARARARAREVVRGREVAMEWREGVRGGKKATVVIYRDDVPDAFFTEMPCESSCERKAFKKVLLSCSFFESF